MRPQFHPLTVARVRPEAAGAVEVVLAVPPTLRPAFAFAPGQFLTLRATLSGREERRNYSICSPVSRLAGAGELAVGIKPVAGGRFSNWAATQLATGMVVDCMPPEGRFTPRVRDARHRVGFAAGSGITPLLSIIATTLEQERDARFTLVYCNQRVGSIMFAEALADLKDRHPTRLALVHLLSRQPQEVPLLNGRLDADKARALLHGLLAGVAIDEAFVCGPAGMIDGVAAALREAGLADDQVHAERFFATDTVAGQAIPERPTGTFSSNIALEVTLDGKLHRLAMAPGERVLEVALAAGLDLPYACKAGVCCTCRARVLEGQARMERNFTLEPAEVARGFVLTCQATPTTARLAVSFDER